MATTQTFETIIKLNSQEAKNQLEQLRKKVDDLKAARDKAIQSKQDSSFIKDINKELKAARSELRSTLTEASDVIDRLSAILAAGIHATVAMDGQDGVAHQLDRFNKMKARK